MYVCSGCTQYPRRPEEVVGSMGTRITRGLWTAMWVLGIEPRTSRLTVELSLQLQIYYIFIHKVFKLLPDRILLEQCPQFPLPTICRVALCSLDSWGYNTVSTNTADTQALLFPSVPSPSLPVNMILCLDSLSTYQQWKMLFFDLKGNKLALA